MILRSKSNTNNDIAFFLGDTLINQVQNSELKEISFQISDTVTKIFICKNIGNKITFSEDWNEEGFIENENLESFSFNYLDITNNKKEWIT